MEKENVFFKQHAKWVDIAANAHLEDESKQMCCLQQTCLPTGEARKYLTTRLSLMCFSWITHSASTRLVGPTNIPRACGLANFLLTVSRCSSGHCRLHSCPVWANTLAYSFRPLAGYKKRTQKLTRVVEHELGWILFELSKELPHTCLVLLTRSGLRWDEDRLPHQFARFSWLRVECDTQSLCDDAVETWSWYPTIELLWSHCDTVKSGDDIQVYCRQKKSICRLWDFWNSICQGLQ